MKNLLILAAVLLFALPFHAQTSSQPAFAAVALDGSRVDTAALRGKVVVLNLWFINCPNCVEEIKLLNTLVDEYKGNKDVVFIGLAASNKPDLEKFLKKYPFKYQIVPNATMIIISKFGTPDKKGEINVPFPMHYILDRDGKIVVKAQGIKGIDAVKTELKKQFAAKTAGTD
jgi:peroxiredoxin